MSRSEVQTSVVIPNYNGAQLLEACLRSIYENSDVSDIELIVIDNGSLDQSKAVAKQFSQLFSSFRFIQNNRNLGVTRALNQGIKSANGKYVVILNNDTSVEKNWLRELICVLESDDSIGGAQCKLLKMDDRTRIDSAGCLVDVHGCPLERGTRYGYNALDIGQYDTVDQVFSAGCPASIFRRKVLVESGMYDPEYFTGCEDLDLCWRIRLMGYKIVFVPKSVVLHRRSNTSLRTDLSLNTWYHFKKNGVATIMKNYEAGHLIRELPFALCIHFLHGLKDLFVKKEPILVAVLLKALFWNAMEFKYLYRQRAFVQRALRRVDDSAIRAHMSRQCLLITDFLAPYWTRE